MNYLIKMALRNIWRNKRRSALAFTSIGLAALLCVFLQGFMGGFIGSIVKNYTKNDTGNIRITTADYAARSDFRPVDANIQDPQAVESKILADPSIKDKIGLMTQRIAFSVLLANQGLNKTASALAGDPKVEEGLLSLQRSIEPGGRYIENRGETIIGAGLAKDLKLAVGDKLKVVTTAADGSLQLKKLTIVGIFNTGVTALDGSVFQMGIADAKEFLRTGGGTQQIIIMLKNYRDSDAVAAQIANLLDNPKLAVVPWTKIGDYNQIVQLESTLMSYVYVIVLFLGAFIITSIMMMIILERRHEIGVLKSMGFSRGETLTLFLWEGIFLGVWGSIIGAGLGMLANLLAHAKGIDFSAATKGVTFPMDSVIYPTVSLTGALVVVVLGIVISALVSILPSRRAARMNAVDAIKSV
ncbi:MAG TPA: FtsX-like permease family protein [Spirochaetia bacterium]|nr:FtsX-like permease family protein [Spirochaetia bacterium]